MKKIILGCILFLYFSPSYALNETNESVYKSSAQEIQISVENENAKIEIRLPRLEKNEMNTQITAYVSDFIQELQKDTNHFEKLSNNWKYELDISGVTEKIGNITTYEISIYSFTGGAHGSTTIKTFNFFENGKLLKIENDKILEKISDYSIDYFKKELENGKLDTQEDWIKEGLKADKNNFKNFLVKKIEKNDIRIEFIFDQYQIAPYYEGNKTIEINMYDLQ